MESTGDLDEIPRRWESHGGNRKPQRVCSRKKEKYGNGHSHDRGSRIASLIAKGSGGCGTGQAMRAILLSLEYANECDSGERELLRVERLWIYCITRNIIFFLK